MTSADDVHTPTNPESRYRIRPTLGVLMLLTAAVFFALNGPNSKLLIQGGFDAPQLTAFRATGALLGLLILSFAVRPGGRRLAVNRSELPRLVIFGLAGFFFVPLTYFIAVGRLPVGIALLFEFTAPVWVALWVHFGERQHVSRRLWAGLALCVAGLVCVTQIWAGEITLDPLGTIAGLGSAILLAAYYVLGSATAAQRDPISLTCWAFGVAALAGAIVRPWWTFPVELLSRSSGGVPIWLLLTYLAIPGTLIPYLLLSAAMRHLPATSVGIIAMIEIVLASAFAWLLIGEVLATPQVLGGLTVLAGVILAETARVTRSKVIKEAKRTIQISETSEVPDHRAYQQLPPPAFDLPEREGRECGVSAGDAR